MRFIFLLATFAIIANGSLHEVLQSLVDEEEVGESYEWDNREFILERNKYIQEKTINDFTNSQCMRMQPLSEWDHVLQEWAPNKMANLIFCQMITALKAWMRNSQTEIDDNTYIATQVQRSLDNMPTVAKSEFNSNPEMVPEGGSKQSLLGVLKYIDFDECMHHNMFSKSTGPYERFEGRNNDHKFCTLYAAMKDWMDYAQYQIDENSIMKKKLQMDKDTTGKKIRDQSKPWHEALQHAGGPNYKWEFLRNFDHDSCVTWGLFSIWKHTENRWQAVAEDVWFCDLIGGIRNWMYKYSLKIDDNAQQLRMLEEEVTSHKKCLQLPAGWKTYTAPDGRYFYHNEQTGVVSWERPC